MNAKDALEKIKELLNITPKVKEEKEAPLVENIEKEEEPKTDLAEEPIEEPVPENEEEPTEEVSIEDRVAGLEAKILEIEKLIEAEEKTDEMISEIEEELSKKDEKVLEIETKLSEKEKEVETLNEKVLELSKDPITEPINLESEKQEETFASRMIERQKSIRAEKGKSY